MREECGTVLGKECGERSNTSLRTREKALLKRKKGRRIGKRVCAPGETHGLAAVFKADF